MSGEPVALELGELRSILQRPASEACWALLLERLLPAAPPSQETLFWQALWPYVLSHLSRWPDHLRRAPAPLAQAWLRAEQLELLPLFRHVSFHRDALLRDKLGKRAHLRALFSHPGLSAISALALHNYDLSTYQIDLILEAKGLVLDALSLNSCTLSTQDLARLLNAPSCARLLAIDAEHLLWGDALTALLDQPSLQSVESLTLGYNRLTRASVDHIEAWSWLRPKHLDLGSNPLGRRGVGVMGEVALERLAQAAPLERLASLNLSATGVGAPLRLPNDAPAWRDLRSLTLGGEPLSAQALSPLASCSLPSLESLTIRRAQQDRLSLDAMRVAPWSSQLRELNLSDNQHDPRAISALERMLKDAQLLTLDLSWNPLGDEGALALASSERFSTLEHLRLRSIGLSDVGALAFFEHGAARSLKSLDLRQNELKDRDLFEALALDRGLSLLL